MRSNHPFSSAILAAALAFACTNWASAQASQRLGFPAGKFQIEASGSTVRTGYCMDRGVPAPKAGTSLQHVLRGAQAGRVRYMKADGNTVEISLAKAVQDGIVELRACEPTLAETDVLELLSGARQFLEPVQNERLGDALAKLRETLNEQDGDARVRISSAVELIEILRDGGGDGRSVRVLNLTDRRVEVEFTQGTVLAEGDFGLGGVRRTSFPEHPFELGSGDWQQEQDAIWIENAAIGAAEFKGDVDAYLKSPERRSPTLTYLRKGETTLVLLREGATLELREVKGGRVSEPRGTGSVAVDKFAAEVRRRVADNSTEKAQFLAVSPHDPSSEVAVLQIGKESVEVDPVEFANLVSADGPTPRLDEVFRHRSTGNFVVIRDEFVRGASQAAGYDESRVHVDPLELAVALHRKFGQRHRFFLDDKMQVARGNLETMPTIKTANDIALLVPRDSFELQDHGTVDVVSEAFDEAGIALIKAASPHPNILVLSGHRDQAFRDFLTNHSKAGTFDGRLLLLFSCYESGSEVLNSELVSATRGAKGVIFFRTEIAPYAVQEVLLELAELLKVDGTKSTRLDELFDASLERVLERSSTKGKLKTEVEKLKDRIFQLSLLEGCEVDRRLAAARSSGKVHAAA